MKLNRLEVFETLKNKEENLQIFKNVMEDVENYYFNTGIVYFELDSETFNPKYGEESTQFNKNNLITYLNAEIVTLEEEIQTLLRKLRE